MGLTLAKIDVHRPEDMGAALGQVTRERAGALFVVPSGPVVPAIQAIIAFASLHRIPTLFPSARWPVDAGGLMSYGVDPSPLLRRSASAKALGLTIPPSLLARADHVVE